jgi:hypothetical protein
LKKDIQNTVAKNSDLDIVLKAYTYNPTDVLSAILNRSPTNSEILNFQSNAQSFIREISSKEQLSSGANKLLIEVSKKLVKLPIAVKSID